STGAGGDVSAARPSEGHPCLYCSSMRKFATCRSVHHAIPARPGALAGAAMVEAPQSQETNPTNGDLILQCGFMRVSHGAPVTSSLQRPLNTGGRFSTK